MILAMLGSKLVEGANQRGVEKKQMALAQHKDIYAKDRAAKAQAMIDQYINRNGVDARKAENESIRSELTDNLQKTVGVVDKFSPAPIVDGKLTPGYTNRVAANNASNATKIGDAIRQMAEIGSPARRSFNDSTQFGRSSIEAGANYDAASRVGSAYDTMISSVRPNPWLSLLSQGLQGYAMGKAMGAGGGVKPEQPPAPVEDRIVPRLRT
jgi:hypothetical protein